MKLVTFFLQSLLHLLTLKCVLSLISAKKESSRNTHVAQDSEDTWHTCSLDFRSQRPKQGCHENSDLRAPGVSKTQTPEKLRPSRFIEKSDPVILLNFCDFMTLNNTVNMASLHLFSCQQLRKNRNLQHFYTQNGMKYLWNFFRER